MGRVDSGHTDGTAGAMTPDALLDAIIDMSDDAIVTTNAQGEVTSWSATA